MEGGGGEVRWRGAGGTLFFLLIIAGGSQHPPSSIAMVVRAAHGADRSGGESVRAARLPRVARLK